MGGARGKKKYQDSVSEQALQKRKEKPKPKKKKKKKRIKNNRRRNQDNQPRNKKKEPKTNDAATGPTGAGDNQHGLGCILLELCSVRRYLYSAAFDQTFPRGQDRQRKSCRLFRCWFFWLVGHNGERINRWENETV